MLLTVLIWHLTATALLLALYLLVTVLQWASTRARSTAARRQRTVSTATVSAVTPVALPGDAPAVASSAA